MELFSTYNVPGSILEAGMRDEQKNVIPLLEGSQSMGRRQKCTKLQLYKTWYNKGTYKVLCA